MWQFLLLAPGIMWASITSTYSYNKLEINYPTRFCLAVATNKKTIALGDIRKPLPKTYCVCERKMIHFHLCVKISPAINYMHIIIESVRATINFLVCTINSFFSPNSVQFAQNLIGSLLFTVDFLLCS